MAQRGRRSQRGRRWFPKVSTPLGSQHPRIPSVSPTEQTARGHAKDTAGRPGAEGITPEVAECHATFAAISG